GVLAEGDESGARIDVGARELRVRHRGEMPFGVELPSENALASTAVRVPPARSPARSTQGDFAAIPVECEAHRLDAGCLVRSPWHPQLPFPWRPGARTPRRRASLIQRCAVLICTPAFSARSTAGRREPFPVRSVYVAATRT